MGTNIVSGFCGTRLEAFQVLNQMTDVQAISTVHDSRVHQYCKERDIPHHLIDKGNRTESFGFLKKQPVQFWLSAGYPFVIPSMILNEGPLFINSHPALLPAYKGYSAIKAAYANRECYMGVTVHKMVEAVDAGEILAQERINVEGLTLEAIYKSLFGAVEPKAISLALELIFKRELAAHVSTPSL